MGSGVVGDARTQPDVAVGDLVRRDREPERQVEIQLGHLCNNRCVFCVSGQRTARGQAGVSPTEPILASIRQARARGHDKITLLGGEPTLQPGFLDILRECAALGFSEVVLFTNGAKTANGKLIDEALATGAKLAFRISIQGATEASHEGTTLKDGSFGRIVRTLSELQKRGQKTTVNMCLVASNHQDVHHFAGLLLPFDVRQLHVDLMRPLDAGDRTDEELAATLAPLSAIGASLTRMVEAFPASFDVNVGNLPFCLAPTIADRIHHDGQATETIAIDGGDGLSAPWDKYATKRRDKIKTPRCTTCVFDAQCTGVYADYVRFQGDAALEPVTLERIEAIDPRHRFTALHTSALLEGLARAAARDGLSLSVTREGLESVRLVFVEPAGESVLRLVPPSVPHRGPRFERFSVEVIQATSTALRWLLATLDALGASPVVPLLEGASLAPRLAGALSRLMNAAPFGALRWTSARAEPDRLELTLAAPLGGEVKVFLSLEAGRRVAFRYTLSADEAPDHAAIRAGLVRLVDALKDASSTASRVA